MNPNPHVHPSTVGMVMEWIIHSPIPITVHSTMYVPFTSPSPSPSGPPTRPPLLRSRPAVVILAVEVTRKYRSKSPFHAWCNGSARSLLADPAGPVVFAFGVYLFTLSYYLSGYRHLPLHSPDTRATHQLTYNPHQKANRYRISPTTLTPH